MLVVYSSSTSDLNFSLFRTKRKKPKAKMPRCYMVKKALCNKYISNVARGFESWGRGRTTPSPTTIQIPVSPIEGSVAPPVAQGTILAPASYSSTLGSIMIPGIVIKWSSKILYDRSDRCLGISCFMEYMGG